MPTCWNCLKEVTIEHFLGGEAPTCQEADLGEPGPAVPATEVQPHFSRAHPQLALLVPRNNLANLANRTASSSSRSPAVDIIRRGTRRRIQAIDRARKESAISGRRSITRNRTHLSAPTNQHPLRKFLPARNRWQRFLSPIPEEEEKEEEEEEEAESSGEVTPTQRSRRRHPISPLSAPTNQHSLRKFWAARNRWQRFLSPTRAEEEKEEKKDEEEEEEASSSGEVTPTQPSSRRPIPPLTPWRRLCLIQDYSDRDEDLRTTINRLDDAIASSPELWTPGTSERIDGQPIPPHQFYRRLHEWHQQRIAHHAPSSVPYFFPRLGAKQYEW
ncbi:hypothetical protein GJ744_000790 [Endocarpon pusillum]|uniref:Uncharacterized protein n=1 Tax=Endocarpon pusillum TaxID=364733 RepID=A0A8H7AAY0_9EURO|nr:hypothetical protein GJ744_000790 [Endocarpon pusillum]